MQQSQSKPILGSRRCLFTPAANNIKKDVKRYRRSQKRESRLDPKSFLSILFPIFTGIVLVIGLIIITFRAPDLSQRKCQLSFTLLSDYPINYNARPIAIASGDFNNDSRLDIVVVFAALESFQILFGTGDGNFTTDYRRYFTGKHASPSSIAVGDINHDRSLDLALTYSGINQIEIFLGSPNGTFHPWTKMPMNDARPIWITIADFNDDQNPDIGIVNRGHETITLMYGNGNGSFETRETHWMGFDSSSKTVIAADMNADGRTDLVVTNSGTNTISILFRNYDSTLRQPIIYSTGFNSRPCSIVAGHFNNDLFLDLAVANRGTQEIMILFGSIEGVLHEHRRYSLGDNSPNMILLADFNKDGIDDLVVSNTGTQSVSFLSGHADGNFDEAIMYTTSSQSKLSMAIGDFNNDNQLDIVSVGYDTNNLEILFWEYRLFQSHTTYWAGFGAYVVDVADLNSDGHLDIVVVNRESRSMRLFFGDGNGSFSSQLNFTTGRWPISVGIADLNHDGHLDILVANRNDSSLTAVFGKTFEKTWFLDLSMKPSYIVIDDFNHDSYVDILVASNDDERIGVLLGRDDGKFFEATSIQTTSPPRYLSVSDLNGDKNLDVVALHTDNTMGIYLGNGNGSFAAPIIYTVGLAPSSLSIAHWNFDNQLDIIVCNRRSNDLNIFFGKGDGTFMNPTNLSLPSRSWFVKADDINSDGKMDVIIAYIDANKIGVMLGHGNGTFGNQTTYRTSSGPVSIATGDFNEDRKIDLVVANLGSHTIDVFIQQVSQNFTQIKPFSFDVGANLNFMIIHDLDNDGFSDIITTASGSKTLGINFGLGGGRFSPVQPYSTGSRLNWATIGDFNKDQHLDIAAINVEKQRIHLFMGTAHRTFRVQESQTIELPSQPLVARADDFNHDGQSDLVVIVDGSNQIYMFTSYDAGFFKIEYTYKGSIAPVYLVSGDLNGDNIVDLVLLHYQDREMSIYLGLGNGGFSGPTSYVTGPASYHAEIDDFNNDQIVDIAITSRSSDSIDIFLGYGNGTFQERQSYQAGSDPKSLAVGDFNEDGKLDLIVANYRSNYTSLLFGNGDGTFQNQTKLFVGPIMYRIDAGYIDHDNHLDVIGTLYEASQLIIFLGQGNGTFRELKTYQTNKGPIHVSLADVDNDSHLDMAVVSYSVGTVELFFGTGDGTFLKTTVLSTGVSPANSAVADVNHDGNADILVANQGENTIGVFLGNGNRSFESQRIFNVGARPICLVIADFNRDARLDIAVVNFWIDTFEILLGYPDYSLFHSVTLSSSPGIQPEMLVLADLNGDNTTDIIVADHRCGKINTFFSHGNMTFSDPYESLIGSSTSVVSLATGDFNQDGLVDIVVVQQNDHSIVLLLSTSNGSLIVSSIYSTGIDSYPNFVSVGHVNKDSYLDIVVSNSGRNNIGVFIGLGDGHFENMMTVAIPHESWPFSVAMGDFDHDQKMDLAVANRNADSIHILLQSCLNFSLRQS